MELHPASENSSEPLQFHLLPAGLDPAAVRDVLPAGCLTVPADVSFLVLEPEPQLVTVRPAGDSAICGFEPLSLRARQPSLLMLRLGGVPLRVNGQAAAPVALLSERDQFELPGGRRFHIAIRQRPVEGTPTTTQLGRKCPLCLQPVVAGTRLYTCACGAPLHAEPDQVSGNPLQCVHLVNACPACERPIVRSAGWSWLPKEIDD